MENNKLINKYIIFVFVSIIFLLSCKNKIEKKSLLEEGFKSHELIVNEKRISFILPEYYTDTFRPNSPIVSYWSGYEKKHVFYSTKNDQNFFSIMVYESNMKSKSEKQIDEYNYQNQIQWAVTHIPAFVPFIEKRKDKYGQIYYLTMSSFIDSIYAEREFELDEQHLFHSIFTYWTYSNNKEYFCVLITRDKIKDFSYKEKQKIIESVKMENIK